MDECCEVREIPLEQRRVLHVVLWINVLMFLVESALAGSPWPDIVIGLFVAGVFGHSAVQVIRDASRAVALSH